MCVCECQDFDYNSINNCNNNNYNNNNDIIKDEIKENESYIESSQSCFSFKDVTPPPWMMANTNPRGINFNNEKNNNNNNQISQITQITMNDKNAMKNNISQCHTNNNNNIQDFSNNHNINNKHNNNNNDNDNIPTVEEFVENNIRGLLGPQMLCKAKSYKQLAKL